MNKVIILIKFEGFKKKKKNIDGENIELHNNSKQITKMPNAYKGNKF